MNVLKKIFLSLNFVLLFSCSYSFTGANTGNIQSLAIPIFDNETPEPGIREKVTQGITKSLIEDNTFKITDSKKADAVLFGKITEVTSNVYTYDAKDKNFSTSDYKITVTARIRMEQSKDKKVMWEENISGWGIYSLTGSKNRESGISDAVKMIAQNVINKVVSDW